MGVKKKIMFCQRELDSEVLSLREMVENAFPRTRVTGQDPGPETQLQTLIGCQLPGEGGGEAFTAILFLSLCWTSSTELHHFKQVYLEKVKSQEILMEDRNGGSKHNTQCIHCGG